MHPLVDIKYGPLRGRQEGSVNIWRGIPYAQAPVGELRFRAPQPPLPWQEVREAAAFGPVAPQLSVGLESRFDVRPNPAMLPVQSEDCLFLNVWTPTAATSASQLPVMVWIHGGSFVTGSGSTPLYDGSRFAARGEVIVVTLNYRLGPLGFLHLAELVPGCDNNLGLLDQLAALRWVHENISAFGGNPERVTLFGESAGAMSIAALLGMPAAQGLFQAVILQSGAARLQPPARAKQVAEALAQSLSAGDPAQLLTLPLAQLLQGAQQLLRTTPGGLPFQPVLDGQTITMHPLVALAAGNWRGLPLLLGTNRDEGNLFVPEDATGQHLERLLAPFMPPEQATYFASHYPASRAGQADLLTDTVFWLPTLQLAEQQLPHGPVWMYRFDWSIPSGRPIAGAFHALELAFVWDALDNPAAQFFMGSAATAPQSLADAMHEAWLAFAHFQHPNRLDWPAYETVTRPTLIFDAKLHLEHDPQSTKRLLWQNAEQL
ncbi:MAG: carboxylesterase/lipase family protein [Janthinobacterium lividum]